MQLCPCGAGQPYENCCGVFHRGDGFAKTAEQLMRSRYAAFCTEDVDYLVETHDKSTRSKNLKQELALSMGTVNWLRLEVTQTIKGQPEDTEGFVRFVAHYLENGRPGRMEELSRFIKRKSRWYYVDGNVS